MIGHEPRTPLIAILACQHAGTLRRSAQKDLRLSDGIVTSVNRLQGIINSILDVQVRHRDAESAQGTYLSRCSAREVRRLKARWKKGVAVCDGAWRLTFMADSDLLYGLSLSSDCECHCIRLMV
jgi:hypothetical protein